MLRILRQRRRKCDARGPADRLARAATLVEAVDDVTGNRKVGVGARAFLDDTQDRPPFAVVVTPLDRDVLPLAAVAIVGVAEQDGRAAANHARHAHWLRQLLVEPDRAPIADAFRASGDGAEVRLALVPHADHDAAV